MFAVKKKSYDFSSMSIVTAWMGLVKRSCFWFFETRKKTFFLWFSISQVRKWRGWVCISCRWWQKLVSACQSTRPTHTHTRLGNGLISTKNQTIFTTGSFENIVVCAFYDFGLVNSYCRHGSIWVNAGFRVKLQFYDINAFASLFVNQPLF